MVRTKTWKNKLLFFSIKLFVIILYLISTKKIKINPKVRIYLKGEMSEYNFPYKWNGVYISEFMKRGTKYDSAVRIIIGINRTKIFFPKLSHNK